MSLGQIVAAGVAGWMFGAMWYGLHGEVWMKAAKITPAMMKPGDFTPYILSFVGALATAKALQYVSVCEQSELDPCSVWLVGLPRVWEKRFGSSFGWLCVLLHSIELELMMSVCFWGLCGCLWLFHSAALRPPIACNEELQRKERCRFFFFFFFLLVSGGGGGGGSGGVNDDVPE